MNRSHLILLALGALLAPVSAAAQDTASQPVEAVSPSVMAASVAHETVCTGRLDEDGDGLPDCADADCYADPHCHAGGSEERSNQACSDWIDNDGDGSADCEDEDCAVDWVTVCRGSYSGGASGGGAAESTDDLPELGEGMSVEDLIGTGGDADGERTDETCADGIDNDNDGRMDCADFGCRFDPQVTVCQGEPGFRFSIVAGAGARIRFGATESDSIVGDTIAPEAGFTALQLRALGPIPFISNSFFLLSIRAEDSVRLAFLMFQLPIGEAGHYLNINSGSGTLTTQRIVSAARLPFLDPAFYMLNVYEQGNGGSVEVGGPVDSGGTLRFRAFVAGGAGNFTGNVGGARIDPSISGSNFAWAAGLQLQLNVVGNTDRFDLGLMYTPEQTTLALWAGAKWDQRPLEQQLVWQASMSFRVWHFRLRAETIGRYAPNWGGAASEAFSVELQALLVPRVLVLAGDVGGNFRLFDYDRTLLPTTVAGDVFMAEEFQYRFSLVWYFWRSVGTLHAIYSENRMGVADVMGSGFNRSPIDRTLRLETRFRF